MNIRIVDEFALEQREQSAIQALLKQSFPEAPSYSQRIYYKQLPHFRVLVELGGSIVGQCGIDHRVISTATGPSTIFGIIDLCISEKHRQQGIASELLRWVERKGESHGVDFLMLFATDPRVYEAVGYSQKCNSLRWMKIHEHESLGIADEPVEELMVKSVRGKEWPTGTVDLLGYLF